MAARQALLNSPEYEAAFSAIKNFQSDHGGANSLQYADDFLTGNMTVDEYQKAGIRLSVAKTSCSSIRVCFAHTASCTDCTLRLY